RLTEHWSTHLSVDAAPTPWELARNWIRATRKRRADLPADLRHQIGTLERMLRLLPARGDKSHLTQEQVAERVKRLRSDWLQASIRDQAARFVPRAAAAREVFMSVAEPVQIGPNDDVVQVDQ